MKKLNSMQNPFQDAEDSYKPTYSVIVTSVGGISRGYIVKAASKTAAWDALRKHLGESVMAYVAGIQIAEILLDEDVIDCE